MSHIGETGVFPVQLAVVVRPMVVGDVDAVLAVQRAAFSIEAQLYDDPSLPPLQESREQLVNDLDGSLGLVALDGVRVVGSVRVRVEGRACTSPGSRSLPTSRDAASGPSCCRGPSPWRRPRRRCCSPGTCSASNLRLYARAGYVEQRRVRVDERVTLVYLRKQLA